MIEIDEARLLAGQLLRWAAGNPARGTSDPVYRLVDSNADARKRGLSLYEVSVVEKWPHRHSSCTFIEHWLLETLGVRLPWVGRETQTVNPFTRLYAAPQAIVPPPELQLYPGDALCIGNSAATWHVQCVLAHDAAAQQLEVAEYGQPGAHIADKVLTRRGGAWYSGSRPVDRVLPLDAVLAAARAAARLGDVVLPDGFPVDPKDVTAKPDTGGGPGIDNEGKG